MKRAVSLATLVLLAACQQQGPKAEQATSQPGGLETGTSQPAEAANSEGEPLQGQFDTQFAGKPAPDVPLDTNPDGATETVADIVKANPGKPVLVNLWATWCAPCLKELPTLDRLAAETKGKLVVVPVSQDMEGWRKVSEAFTAAKFPNLATRVESQMQFGFQAGAKGLPLTILYDAQGKEVWRYAGDRDWSSAESRAKLGV
jgi:thiol-disulfide isomerase/thioredoxin